MNNSTARKHRRDYTFKEDLLLEDEVTKWNIYNTISEIENLSRGLKTDLDLRAVYHRFDAGPAQPHLGLLVYQVVITVWWRVKAHGISGNWQKIVRIGNIQKIIAPPATNKYGGVIGVRKCLRQVMS
ncbi:MAG: hypothetical protein H7Z13_03340 [Ferruginibacter sp.]|nr:hypothetical protein [Ferruginibacter sp.]